MKIIKNKRPVNKYGEPHGEWITYRQDKIHVITNFKNGVKHGVEKKYFSNGQIEKIANYVDGKKNGLYKKYDSYGRTMLKKFFLNDKLHGDCKIYDELGHLSVSCHYKNGLLDGDLLRINSQGKIYKKEFYDEDRFRGAVIFATPFKYESEPLDKTLSMFEIY